MALETETFEQSNRAHFTRVFYNGYLQLKLHINDQKRKTHKLPMHTLQNRHVSVKNPFKCNTIAHKTDTYMETPSVNYNSNFLENPYQNKPADTSFSFSLSQHCIIPNFTTNNTLNNKHQLQTGNT